MAAEAGARVGATTAMDDAVDAAIEAKPNAEVPLDVPVDRKALRKFVRKVDRQIAKPAENATLIGLRPNYEPKIRASKTGREVDRKKLTAYLLAALRSEYRGLRITVPTVPVQPEVGAEDLGPVIVIKRGSNHLTLFDGASRVRDFTVATGAAQYPTPTGSFEIVVMERNPTWNPPDSDWAKGASRFRPARATRSARAGWASPRRPSGSTARPTWRRSATPRRTAASAWRFPRPSGSSTTSASGRPSTSSRRSG